jgi:hypothetical protein
LEPQTIVAEILRFDREIADMLHVDGPIEKNLGQFDAAGYVIRHDVIAPLNSINHKE